MKCTITIEYERGKATEPELELLSQLLGLPTTTKTIQVSEKPSLKDPKDPSVKESESKVVEEQTQVVEDVKDPEPEITLDDVRRICTAKAKNNREEVMNILKGYGCSTIFALPKENYNEFKMALENL